MMYVSLDDFNRHIGAAAADDLYARITDLPGRLESCEQRILAYIMPRKPCAPDEVEALCYAVYTQLAHECSSANAQLDTMPEGVASFSVNGFSAQLNGKTGGVFGAAGLCRSARAALALSGLLYRGVNIC